ncbi:MAG: hypothetical protein JSV91_15310, partial [Phycisphaerales bacterium]
MTGPCLFPAVAAGVAAIFMECHPNPPPAKSDASTVRPLAAMPQILSSLVAICAATDRAQSLSAAGA